jgi:hypothetical protein
LHSDSEDNACILVDGESEISVEELGAVRALLALVRQHRIAVPEVDDLHLAKCIRIGSISFLRCVNVFLGALGVASASACESGNIDALVHAVGAASLPQLIASALQHPDLRQLLELWLSQYSQNGTIPVALPFEIKPPRLIELPPAFATLALQSVKYLCSRTQSAPLIPAMCLTCGLGD